jgi:hypothetical protein
LHDGVSISDGSGGLAAENQWIRGWFSHANLIGFLY